MLQQITTLLKKELISEFRYRISLNSIFLYLTSTIFIVYLIFNSLEELKSWVAIYWIILVFAATNACLNSFRLESGRQFYYYFGLVKPIHLILSKMIFNALLIELIAFLAYGLIALLIGNPVENLNLFLGVISLGSLALSSVLTLVSAIASKTDQNSSLMAILAFPILLPVLLTAIKASLLSGLGFGWDECQTYLLSLVALNVIIVVLSLLLFPYLWRS